MSLTVDARRTAEQRREIEREERLLEELDDLLGDREARVFPPDHLIPEWQIFLRHSRITTHTYGTFVEAAKDLLEQLMRENKVWRNE